MAGLTQTFLAVAIIIVAIIATIMDLSFFAATAKIIREGGTRLEILTGVVAGLFFAIIALVLWALFFKVLGGI